MITIEKTYYDVKGTADDKMVMRIQELIADANRQYGGFLSKALIYAENVPYS